MTRILVLMGFLALLSGACGGGGGAASVASDSPPSELPPAQPEPEPEPEPEPAPDWSDVHLQEVSAEVGLVAGYEQPPGDWKWVGDLPGSGAVGDFNRDGWQDVFVLSGGSAPDCLFLNDGDGTFTDHAVSWGIDAVHRGTGVAVADYDGDGWLDIFVASAGGLDPYDLTPGPHRLYRNKGGSGFEEVGAQAGLRASPLPLGGSMGAAFGDYDLDGDLDLIVCGWADAYQGTHLFANDGQGSFQDVTATVLPPYAMYAFSPRFVDMDGDRLPELLIAADTGTSAYFVNRGGVTFENKTQASGTGLDTNGMGHAVADLNGDGLLDWFVTSIYLPEPPGGGPPTGNTYYVNQGERQFVEQAAANGLQDGNWGWGTVAVDIDHDGRQDLVATNGFDVGQEGSPYVGVRSRIYMNGGPYGFTDVATACGLDHLGQGRGLVRLDLENDGDQDLIIFGCREPLAVYRNDTDTPHHWLRVLLDTSPDAGLAPDGFGTRVTFRTGAVTQVRMFDGGYGYLGNSELVLHVGLKDAAIVDELRVEWVDGRVTTLTDVVADQILTVTSPGP